MLTVRHLTYELDNCVILKNVNISMNSGEIVGVTGSNGTGKTTLLNLLMGVIKCQKGDIYWEEQVKKAILYQESTFPEWVTAKDAIDLFLGLQRHHEDTKEMINLIDSINLNKEISQLSGGEKRFLDFVLTLSGNPNFLILDEPTTAMDISTEAQFWGIIDNLIELGTTMIIVMHDINMLRKRCHTIYELNNGDLDKVYINDITSS
ncbi:ATP-binding cassette domain-containing protein [Staphylococcus agnetis]|uniref:ATP-binding cassette domain-containing protein n=1 Tax=Staphylococcus agnetis TaxID=985762 RepID=UPI00118B95CF|nr:ATP-binding cassette domain-containing protein [Staphylococcus agnetis]QDW98902.1 ATP-binding cassette domain-containing protein [Staphylococcus agnetis]